MSCQPSNAAGNTQVQVKLQPRTRENQELHH